MMITFTNLKSLLRDSHFFVVRTAFGVGGDSAECSKDQHRPSPVFNRKSVGVVARETKFGL